MSIRILIADDNKIVRDCLRALFEKEPAMKVVAEAENGLTAIELARSERPDVVVMDFSMPDLNGIEATRQIVGKIPEVRVLVLTIHSDNRTVARILEAGASGFLTMDYVSDGLVRAVRTVLQGRIYLSPDLAASFIQVLTPYGPPRIDSITFSLLTAKEREILQLIAGGNSSREIASCLQVGIKTVNAHRRRMMEKLDINSIAGLTKYAIREGISSLNILK